jgi:hypothetical protein
MRLEMTAGDRPISRPAADMLPVRATRANISRSLMAVTWAPENVTVFGLFLVGIKGESKLTEYDRWQTNEL